MRKYVEANPGPRPNAADVARRLHILKFVIVHAVSNPSRELLDKLFTNWPSEERQKYITNTQEADGIFWGRLESAGLSQYMSPWERNYAETPGNEKSRQNIFDATWRMEAAYMLMWALKLIDVLPPFDQTVSVEVLKTIPFNDVEAFVHAAVLRQDREIDDARDLAELWHWRSRTRTLIEAGETLAVTDSMRSQGLTSYEDIVRVTASLAEREDTFRAINGDFPARGRAYRDLSAEEWSEVGSIAMERHFALNWLCGYAPENRWDDTPTDT